MRSRRLEKTTTSSTGIGPASKSACLRSSSASSIQSARGVADAAEREVRLETAGLGAEAERGELPFEGRLQVDERLLAVAGAEPDRAGPAGAGKRPDAADHEIERRERLGGRGDRFADRGNLRVRHVAQEVHRPMDRRQVGPADLGLRHAAAARRAPRPDAESPRESRRRQTCGSCSSDHRSLSARQWTKSPGQLQDDASRGDAEIAERSHRPSASPRLRVRVYPCHQCNPWCLFWILVLDTDNGNLYY